MQTVILRGGPQRQLAKQLIECAPPNAVVTIKQATRSNDQNSKMRAMMSDISRAKPEGRLWTPETWKCAIMHSLGHQVQFCEGLDGSGPFPMGFRSSRLTTSRIPSACGSGTSQAGRTRAATAHEPS